MILRLAVCQMHPIETWETRVAQCGKEEETGRRVVSVRIDDHTTRQRDINGFRFESPADGGKK